MIVYPPIEGFMPLRISDWNRVKRRISKLTSPHITFSTLTGVFLGYSGSAILAFISYIWSKDPNPWVTSFFLLTSIFSFLVAILCFYFHHKNAKALITDKEDIEEDMKEIEKNFQF